MSTKQKYIFFSVVFCCAGAVMIYLSHGLLQKHKMASVITETVSSYLKYSSGLQWDKAQELLTGEALIQTIRNQDAAVEKEKIIDISMTVAPNGELATVDADVIKVNDRQAYTFYLIQTTDNWLIYKVEYKDFTRPILDRNKGHSAAETALSRYLSLNTKQRVDNAEKYLAGNLLRAELMNRPLQPKQHLNERQEKVLSIEPVGAAEDLVTYKATIETSSGHTATLLVDLVRVKDIWKIINIETIKVEV